MFGVQVLTVEWLEIYSFKENTINENINHDMLENVTLPQLEEL